MKKVGTKSLSLGTFLLDPRGAGLHLAFQFSYIRLFVPAHSFIQRDKGTLELWKLGTWKLVNWVTTFTEHTRSRKCQLLGEDI